jgi:hypothetical protein
VAWGLADRHKLCCTTTLRGRFNSGLNLYLDVLQNIPGEVLVF